MIPRKLRYSCFAFFLLGSCAVKAGNPGPPTGKLDLTVSIINMESGAPLSLAVELDGPNGHLTADESKTHTFSQLSPGEYSIQAANGIKQVISLSQTGTVELRIPRPSAPALVRGYLLNEFTVCLLWDDHSGLEDGFRVTGPRKYKTPANVRGVLDRSGPSSKGVGSYVVWATNEYGDSVTAVGKVVAAASVPPIEDIRRCRTKSTASVVNLIPGETP